MTTTMHEKFDVLLEKEGDQVNQIKLDNSTSLEDSGIRGALCKQKKYYAKAVFSVCEN